MSSYIIITSSDLSLQIIFIVVVYALTVTRVPNLSCKISFAVNWEPISTCTVLHLLQISWLKLPVFLIVASQWYWGGKGVVNTVCVERGYFLNQSPWLGILKLVLPSKTANLNSVRRYDFCFAREPILSPQGTRVVVDFLSATMTSCLLSLTLFAFLYLNCSTLTLTLS